MNRRTTLEGAGRLYAYSFDCLRQETFVQRGLLVFTVGFRITLLASEILTKSLGFHPASRPLTNLECMHLLTRETIELPFRLHLLK
jgi:hypothetical protein